MIARFFIYWLARFRVAVFQLKGWCKMDKGNTVTAVLLASVAAGVVEIAVAKGRAFDDVANLLLDVGLQEYEAGRVRIMTADERAALEVWAALKPATNADEVPPVIAPPATVEWHAAPADQPAPAAPAAPEGAARIQAPEGAARIQQPAQPDVPQ